MTRVFFLGDKAEASQAIQILRAHGAAVVGLGLHEPQRRRAGDQVLGAAHVPDEAVFLPHEIRDGSAWPAIEALGAEIAVSFLYGHILPSGFLDLFPRGAVNLHPAYLPYNRGAYPNVWSIVDGTPAGATLHRIDAGIDTGPIVAQRRVEVLPWDTGATLYARLMEACLRLLDEAWPDVAAGRTVESPQEGPGTLHRVRDVRSMDRIDRDSLVRAGSLIDILRARTFPPHRGAYFEAAGRKVYLRLELEPEELT